jgi:hypothetical protein
MTWNSESNWQHDETLKKTLPRRSGFSPQEICRQLATLAYLYFSCI